MYLDIIMIIKINSHLMYNKELIVVGDLIVELFHIINNMVTDIIICVHRLDLKYELDI